MPRLSADAVSLRQLTLAIAALVLLVACEKPNPVASPIVAPDPKPGAAATTGAAVKPVAAANRATPITFTSDDPRVASEVGLRTAGLDLSTIGKRGLLAFGPYIPLAPANYEVEFKIVVHPGHAGVVRFDVVHSLGNQTLAAKDLDAATLAASVVDGTLTTLPFTVPEPITDLEVRVIVTGQSKLSISGYTIRPKP